MLEGDPSVLQRTAGSKSQGFSSKLQGAKSQVLQQAAGSKSQEMVLGGPKTGFGWQSHGIV
jgi:hypothetical protein